MQSFEMVSNSASVVSQPNDLGSIFVTVFSFIRLAADLLLCSFSNALECSAGILLILKCATKAVEIAYPISCPDTL